MPLAKFSVALERAVNPLIKDESYGAIARLMLVVVAVYDDPDENLASSKNHNKSGTYKHPVTNERVKYFSLAVPFSPLEISSLSEQELRKKLIAKMVMVIEDPEVKISKGLEYERLAQRLNTLLRIFGEAAFDEQGTT